MVEFKKKVCEFDKVYKVVAVIFASLFALGFLMVFPFVRSFIVFITEIILDNGLRRPDKWKRLMLNYGIATMVVSLFVLSALFWIDRLEKAIDTLFCNIKTKFYPVFCNYARAFFVIFIVFLVSYSSLILANSSYRDDYERIALGNNMGFPWSRYVACFLANVFTTDVFLLDMFPFTQLLSIVMLAFSACVVIYGFNGNKKSSFVYMIAVLPLGVFPYYLECMSYRFDSLYNMTFSVLFSVLPVLFIGSSVAFPVSTLICTLLMCTTYQASCGLFPVIMVLVTLYRLNTEGSKKEFWMTFMSAAVSYFVGLILFKLFICTNYESYASSNLMKGNEIVFGFLKNLRDYWKVCLTDMRPLWKILSLISVCISVVLSICKSKLGFVHSLLINLLGFGLLFFICLGAYPALDSANRFYARYMIGFGFLLACLFVYFCSICGKKIIALSVVLPVSWSMCAFALFYGNIVRENDLYNRFRMATIVNDLNNFDFMNNGVKKNICIRGVAGKSEILLFKPEYCRNLIDKLVCGPLDNNSWNQMLYFTHYFNFPDIQWKDMDYDRMKPYLINSTMYQNYYYNGEDLLIEFTR